MQNISLSKSIFIFVLVAAFLVFEMAVQVSPSVMTHQLMLDLHLNPVQLGWMSGCYFFTYTLMQIPAGLLYDRFNVRYVIIFPLLVCACGVLLFSFSQNFLYASLARVLMGTGSAFAFIGVLVVAADIFPKRYFALLAGLTQMLAAFGAMGGQLPLLALVHLLDWRYAMVCLSIIGFILAILIYTFVHYQKCPSMIMCDQRPANILDSLKKIITQKQMWFIALYACFLWAPMAAFASLWGVPYLTRNFSIPSADAAIAISMMWLGLALTSPLLGWWSDKLGKRCIPLLSCAVVAFITFLLILIPEFLTNHWLYITLFIAGGACTGQALSFALVRDHTLVEYRAAAIGFNNMAVVIAGAIFQPLIGKIIAWHAGIVVDNPALYHVQDFRYGLSLIAIGLLLAVLITLFLIRENKTI